MMDAEAQTNSSTPTLTAPGGADISSTAEKNTADPAAGSNSTQPMPASKHESTSISDLSFNTQINSQTHSNNSTFLKPPTRLGKLIPLPGSVVDTPIKLEKQLTSFGREPQSDVVYPDPLDTRVPRAAIDILFWRPGMERETRRPACSTSNSSDTSISWTAPADAWALVASRSSSSACIAVNGVRLPYYEDERHGWIYGVLRHGDVVSIFEGPTGFLKYRCEFYVGLSRVPRKLGEDFRVEVEVEKYVARKSRVDEMEVETEVEGDGKRSGNEG